MFQVNQSFMQLVAVTGGESSWLAGQGWLFGLLVAVLVGLVILGGIQGIARVTSRVVPLMGLIYVAAGVAIILINYDRVPAAFASIFLGAFSADGVAGGAIGVLFQGFQRAAISN